LTCTDVIQAKGHHI